MRTKTALLVLLVSVAALSFAFAADDVFMGTWKLEQAKSKIPAGAPHNNTVVYAQSGGDQVRVTGDGVDGSGKATHSEWTGKFDRKDHPVKGIASHDARAYTKVDAHTLTYLVRKGGKTIGRGRVVVAPDGKSRTVTESSTGPKGKSIESVSVFNKQ